MTAKVLGLAVYEVGHAVVGTIFGATVDHAVLADDVDDGLCRFTNSIRGATPNRYRPEIAAAGAVAAWCSDTAHDHDCIRSSSCLVRVITGNYAWPR